MNHESISFISELGASQETLGGSPGSFGIGLGKTGSPILCQNERPLQQSWVGIDTVDLQIKSQSILSDSEIINIQFS